jgi:hypothetical protein
LIDFVGDTLALLACFAGSGVATFRSGVQNAGLAGVDFFGVLAAAPREGVPNSARAGTVFCALPRTADLGDPAVRDCSGVPAFLKGEPSAAFTGVCFPGLFFDEFTQSGMASILTGIGVFVVGVPSTFFGVPPAVVFFGVTLLIGSSHTK